MEEEKFREMREEKEDVTKKTDLSDFYFNLVKNVAFGAGMSDSAKTKKQPEVVGALSPEKFSLQATDSSSESSRLVKSHQDNTAVNLPRKLNFEGTFPQPISDTSMQEQAASMSSASDRPRPDHHRRSEDALAAAKERFLA